MRLGILGGGQLGRMLALAAAPLGVSVRCLDEKKESPAAVAAQMHVASYTDSTALTRFAEGLDVVTCEFENVPAEASAALAERLPVYPSPRALAVASDRLAEKGFLREVGVPTATFAAVCTPEEATDAAQELGIPLVLKSARFGYDGKGQVWVREVHDAAAAFTQLGCSAAVAEAAVPFRRELSILAVRGRDGTTVRYPLVENYHEAGILRRSLAPAPGVSAATQAQAEQVVQRVLEGLDYVGVIAVECFELADGGLAVNEIAPRVHNSGHWSIEGAETSQFENHVRAVLGLPLGSTAPRGVSEMHNLIGKVPSREAVLHIPGAHLHLYDKTPRPGRKLGHVTVCAEDAATLAERVAQLRARLGDEVVGGATRMQAHV